MEGVTFRDAIAVVAGGALLASAWYLGRPGPRVEAGSRTPAVTVPVVANGTGPTRLAAPGQVTVVEFFASWCGVCAATVPGLERRLTRDGVRFIAVSVDEDPASARAAATRWNLIGPVAWDDGKRAVGAYGIRALPTTIVTAADGRVVATHVGPVSDATLKAEIERAQGNRT